MLECKKVVKNGIIWIKSKQSVKNIIILEKARKEWIKADKKWRKIKDIRHFYSLIQEAKNYWLFMQNWAKMELFLLTYEVSDIIFLNLHLCWHLLGFHKQITVISGLFARFWVGIYLRSSFPVICQWKPMEVQQKWKVYNEDIHILLKLLWYLKLWTLLCLFEILKNLSFCFMLKSSLSQSWTFLIGKVNHFKTIWIQEYFCFILFNAFECKIFADFKNFKYAKVLHLIRGA